MPTPRRRQHPPTPGCERHRSSAVVVRLGGGARRLVAIATTLADHGLRRPSRPSRPSRGGRPVRDCETRLVYGISAISRAFFTALAMSRCCWTLLPGDPPVADLGPVADEAAEQVDVLVVDELDLVGDEDGRLLLELLGVGVLRRTAPCSSCWSFQRFLGGVVCSRCGQNGARSAPTPVRTALRRRTRGRGRGSEPEPDEPEDPPPEEPPPVLSRAMRSISARAQRRDGPISSAMISTTVRFSPSFVS